MATFVFSGIMCVGLIIFAGKRKSFPFERRITHSNKADRIEQAIQRTRDKVMYWSSPCQW
jgi:hypothetical protein